MAFLKKKLRPSWGICPMDPQPGSAPGDSSDHIFSGHNWIRQTVIVSLFSWTLHCRLFLIIELLRHFHEMELD